MLLLVVAFALTVVGIAMAWPKGDGGSGSVASAGNDGGAGQGSGGGKAAGGGDDGSDAQGAAVVPDEGGEILPDTEPSPEAQRAIDAALAKGRPPQFVVVSFDGAADYRMYDRWLKVADESGARFTFFISGIYMLLPERAKAEYQPPNEPAGFSNLGGYAELAGPKSAAENLRDNINDFNEARAKGHEIGSHYVSHLCEQAETWTVDDWISEENQFERLMTKPSEVNGIDLPTPIYTADEIRGGRTPCLAGNKRNLYAAMKQLGFEYDASQPGIYGVWPDKQQGLWNFSLPSIERVGSEYPVMAMDYNFYVNHGKATSQAQADEFEELAYQSYMKAINGLKQGTRAPFITGSHFANWNKGAYMDALERTIRDQCGRPEVACVNMITLARWLDQQSPADLERWNLGDFGARQQGAATDAAAG